MTPWLGSDPQLAFTDDEHPLVKAALSVLVHEPPRAVTGEVWNRAVRAAAKAVRDEMRKGTP